MKNQLRSLALCLLIPITFCQAQLDSNPSKTSFGLSAAPFVNLHGIGKESIPKSKTGYAVAAEYYVDLIAALDLKFGLGYSFLNLEHIDYLPVFAKDYQLGVEEVKEVSYYLGKLQAHYFTCNYGLKINITQQRNYFFGLAEFHSYFKVAARQKVYLKESDLDLRKVANNYSYFAEEFSALFRAAIGYSMKIGKSSELMLSLFLDTEAIEIIRGPLGGRSELFINTPVNNSGLMVGVKF